MRRPGPWFAALALVSALLSIRIAFVPIGILLGKIPDAPADLILQVAFTEALPVLAPGALLILFAWWCFSKRDPHWQWVLALAAAPLASFALLVLL